MEHFYKGGRQAKINKNKQKLKKKVVSTYII